MIWALGHNRTPDRPFTEMEMFHQAIPFKTEQDVAQFIKNRLKRGWTGDLWLAKLHEDGSVAQLRRFALDEI